MIRKRKQTTWLFPLLIALCTFIVFRSWPLLEREWLVQGVTFIVTFFIVQQFYYSRSFFYVILYCLVLFLNVLGGDALYEDYNTVALEMFKYCIPGAITYYLLKTKDIKGIQNTVILFLALIVFTTVSSFIINLSFPGIIRIYVGYINGHEDQSQFLPFLRLGMSNYYLPHALPVLIPALFLGVSNRDLKKSVRILALITWICVVVLTYLSGATTALLFSILFSIVVLFIRRTSLKKNLLTFAIAFLIIIPLLAERQLLSNVLYNLEETLIGTDYSVKVVQLADIVESGQVTDGDAGERSDLYTLTVTQFFKHPLLGTDESVGGHSALLDRLACLGLLGFIPFIMFFVLQIKFVLKYLRNDLKVFYILGVIIAVLMLFLKYMLYVEMSVIMLTILPLTVILFGKESKKLITK